MSTNSSSEKTRNNIIRATGELAAEVGLFNVSTRAVAQRSNENIGSIHYHFGGKDGLFRAVIEDVVEGYLESETEAAVDELGSSPSPEAISRVLRLIISTEIRKLFLSGKPRWHSQVIYQLLQRDCALADLLSERLVEPRTRVMNRLLQLADPSFSSNEVYLHCFLSKMPIYAHAHYETAILKQLKQDAYSKEYLANLEDLLVRQAQLLLGLPPV